MNNNFSNNKSLNFIILFIAVFFIFISNFVFLLNFDSVYWDGWVIYNQDIPTLSYLFHQIQNSIHGYLIFFLLEIGNGLYSFRVLMFLMHLLVAFMLFGILKRITYFGLLSSFLLSSTYFLLPIFQSRVSISIIPFYFSVFLFFLAWYFYSYYFESKSFLKKTLVILFFFLSFTTNSLMVFYFVFLLYLFIVKYYQHGEFFTKFLVGEFVFLVLPFLFFLFKINFLVPNGIYQGYNGFVFDIDLIYLKWLFNHLTSGIFIFDKLKIKELFFSFWFYALLPTIVFSVILNYYLKRGFLSIYNICIPNLLSFIFFLAAGCFLVSISYFPYLVVGKVPTLYGWDSRFMIIAFLPYAFMIYGLMGIFFHFSLKLFFIFKFNLNEQRKINLFLSSFFFVFIVFSMRSMSEQNKYNVDWFYQVGIKENFRESEVVKMNDTFMVKSHLNKSFYNDRVFNHYEWNGLLKDVFGNDEKLMITSEYFVFNVDELEKQKQHKQYNFSSWSYSHPVYIDIHQGDFLSLNVLLKLYYYRVFDYEKFKKIAKDLVYLNFLNK